MDERPVITKAIKTHLSRCYEPCEIDSCILQSFVLLCNKITIADIQHCLCDMIESGEITVTQNGLILERKK